LCSQDNSDIGEVTTVTHIGNGDNNRSIRKVTASSYTPNSYGSSSSGKETAALLHTAWPQQQRHWRGNSAFTANSNATTNAASAQQRLSTALPTATALVVKVKARTSNVYVQNVTR
jgi:hypothetical protein